MSKFYKINSNLFNKSFSFIKEDTKTKLKQNKNGKQFKYVFFEEPVSKNKFFNIGRKGFKELLNDVKVFINDELVNEGMLEYLNDNLEIYNDDVQQFILKIDEDDFVDNVIMDIKDYI